MAHVRRLYKPQQGMSKRCHPLPFIDKLIDNASCFKSLSFMDAYYGYNQILMHPEDQSKTAFITEHGNFCYRVMPFGLKNAGATYQRLMDKVFHKQIGRNMKIYMDNMVAKTTPERSHCEDLREIIIQVRAYNMRLNPEKCAFGVQGGKFLKFMLTSRGIEANPKKCDTILNMAYPKTIKEVQQLAGRVAALSRFLPAVSSRLFQSRPASKSQILADFIFKLTLNEHHYDQTWELHVDRTSNQEGSEAGIVLKEGDKVMAKGEFQVKDPLLERYWLVAKDLISKFDKFIILHVHREKNIRADILSKLAATRAGTQSSTLSQLTLEKSSIELLSITSINHLHDWRTPFLEYINTKVIPRNKPNPQYFKRKASLYTNIAGELYRHGFSHLLLKCLDKNEANEVMNEVHEGVCRNHIGGRALATKIIRTGYYWPTVKKDCITKVKTYDNCQKHATVSMKPAEVMHSMEVSWPFHRWGSISLAHSQQHRIR
ncbi:uncharacterized protein [Arachis hypogaea]|uniref:uncharacterized protein n=1 Tax=Arachis hypogaea TaxID=3818 RepID=UPI003B2269E8